MARGRRGGSSGLLNQVTGMLGRSGGGRSRAGGGRSRAGSGLAGTASSFVSGLLSQDKEKGRRGGRRRRR